MSTSSLFAYDDGGIGPLPPTASPLEVVWALGSEHVRWARPVTFAYILGVGWVALVHFIWRHWWRNGWRRYYVGATAVRTASAPASWHVGPVGLLLFRASVFAYSFWTLFYSSVVVGPSCLRFFTVWNFAALVAFFALGTGLSCSCCRDVALMRKTPSLSHRIAAAAHHLLLEVQLPMAAMIAIVVWLVLYPYEQIRTDLPDSTAVRLAQYTNLTSLTMHAANFVFMLVEFGLDALHVTPSHVGLVLAWGMLYALFNGLQAFWTNDTIYFFCDFTLAKTPFVAVGLTFVMLGIFGLACSLSRLKWRLLLGAAHPRNPHAHDEACCCAPIGTSTPPDGLLDDLPLHTPLGSTNPILTAHGGGGEGSCGDANNGADRHNGITPYVSFLPPSVPGVEYSGTDGTVYGG